MSGTEARGRSISSLPGPRGLPLLGNAASLKKERVHLIIEDWARTYGDLFRFKIGPTQFVAIADAEVVRATLQDRPNAFRRALIEPIFDELGISGLFSVEGTQWRRQRQLVAPAFKITQLKTVFDRIDRTTAQLMNFATSAAENGEPVDALDLMKRYTIDVTTELAFGVKLGALERSDNVLQKHLANIFAVLGRRASAAIPYWRVIKLGSDRTVERSLAYVREIVDGLITAARQRLDADPGRLPENMLEAMLGEGEDGSPAMSDDEVYGNVITMLLAGEDTTANTMAWMLHYVCERPDVQRRIQAEVDRVLGDSSRPSSYAQAAELEYVAAVAYETLRIRSTAPMLWLMANEDTTVADVAIEKDTAVCLLTRLVGLKDDAFTEPDRFCPERWLKAERPSDWQHEPKRSLAFGAGSRICPGRALSLLEMQMVIASVCRHFDVATATNTPPPEEVFAFSVHPRGIHVRLTRRKGD